MKGLIAIYCLPLLPVYLLYKGVEALCLAYAD